MGMHPQLWRSYIETTLQKISSEQFQRTAWFEEKNGAFSPEELINQLFNDYLFDEFIEDAENELSPEQKKLAVEFSTQLRQFCRETPVFLDPKKIICDPRWASIRIQASNLLNGLSAV